LEPIGIDQSQIHEPAAETVLEIFQNFEQPVGIFQSSEIIIPDDEIKRRFSFHQKKGYRPLGIGNDPGGSQQEFRLNGALGYLIIDDGDKYQRDERYAPGEKHNGTPDPPVVHQMLLSTWERSVFL
jgi:hypothetical protein